jgi:hypothetical protein
MWCWMIGGILKFFIATGRANNPHPLLSFLFIMLKSQNFWLDFPNRYDLIGNHKENWEISKVWIKGRSFKII